MLLPTTLTSPMPNSSPNMLPCLSCSCSCSNSNGDPYKLASHEKLSSKRNLPSWAKVGMSGLHPLPCVKESLLKGIILCLSKYVEHSSCIMKMLSSIPVAIFVSAVWEMRVADDENERVPPSSLSLSLVSHQYFSPVDDD